MSQTLYYGVYKLLELQLPSILPFPNWAINKISQVTNLFFVYVAVIQQKWSQALNLLFPIPTSQM